ncbi:MAG: hypothetical protein ABEJ65_11580 [bacterium]
MSDITPEDRREADESIQHYLEHPEDYEDVTDDFLPSNVEDLFVDFIQGELDVESLDDLSTDEKEIFFQALQEHFKRIQHKKSA